MSAGKPILIFVGRGGWTIYYETQGDTTRRVSGYSYERDQTVQTVAAAGCPVVDVRDLPLAELCTLAFQGPLVDQSNGNPKVNRFLGEAPVAGQGLDGCGYGPIHSAPVDVFIRLYAGRGATILNYDINGVMA